MTADAGPTDLVHLGPPPCLIGHRCSRCGRVAFPPDPYGCERCGAPAEELERHEMAAAGRIRAVAVVHRHHRPEPPTPFTVATIALDDGPTLKAVLVGDPAAATVGARVVGMPVPHDAADGDGAVELRFEVAP